jgi:hypothetical protein
VPQHVGLDVGAVGRVVLANGAKIVRRPAHHVPSAPNQRPGAPLVDRVLFARRTRRFRKRRGSKTNQQKGLANLRHGRKFGCAPPTPGVVKSAARLITFSAWTMDRTMIDFIYIFFFSAPFDHRLQMQMKKKIEKVRIGAKAI